MKNKATQTTISPTVEYLTDILSQIASGTLSVPKFHRLYVWKADDMLALFDSIYSSYPIGSFVFWKSDEIQESFSIGHHTSEKSTDIPKKYILDGFQRLFTLYNALNLSSENQDTIPRFYFNLKTKEFIYTENEQDIPVHYFPMKSLLKTTEFIKTTRKIIAHSEYSGEELVEQAEILLQIFRQYRVSVIQIEGGDIDDATQIFLRLNSRGVLIPKDEFNAITA